MTSASGWTRTRNNLCLPRKPLVSRSPTFIKDPPSPLQRDAEVHHRYIPIVDSDPMTRHFYRPRPHNMNQPSQIRRQRCRCLLTNTPSAPDRTLRTRDNQGVRPLCPGQILPRIRFQNCPVAVQVPLWPDPRGEEEGNTTRHSHRFQNPHRRGRLRTEPRKCPSCYICSRDPESHSRSRRCQIRERPR